MSPMSTTSSSTFSSTIHKINKTSILRNILTNWLGSFLLALSGGSSGSTTGGGSRGVFEELELKTSLQSNGGNALDSVLDHVRNGQSVGVSDGQRDGSEVVGSASEFAEEGFGVNVEDIGSEDCTIIVDEQDFHTESKRLDIQLLQDSSFGVTDLLSLFADLEFLDDFDLTLLNLGGDIQSVEERDLRGVKTSGARWDDDFEGSEGTDLSRGGDLVAFDEGLKFMDGGIREDEADFTLAALDQLFDLWDLGVVLLSEFVVLISLFRSLKSDVDSLLDDGLERD